MDKNNNILQRVSSLIKEISSMQDELQLCKEEKKEIYDKYLKLKKNSNNNQKFELKHFDMVTILFIEFFGFSSINQDDEYQMLIDELDNIYFEIDNITKKYKTQRIKTIGDVYLCVGGIPEKNTTNSIDIALASIEIRRFLEKRKEYFKSKGMKFWSYKMGIHTGSVIAEISGAKKKKYNIKGNNVDVADRVKSIAYKGDIAVSSTTYELIKSYFSMEYKVSLPAKYSKAIAVYNIKRIKKALSENREGLVPNEIFTVKYKIRQLTDLQEYVLNLLENKLPDYLYYHNVKHTIDVYTQVEIIGIVEGVNDYELLLLKTAALFHDVGQIHGSKNHEEKSCEYARNILPKYKYTEEEIAEIEKLIMATKLPPNPQTLLEKIMCDADLDYLGRKDFIPVSKTLFKELKAQNIITNENEWNKMQIKFLESHTYFTNTANKLREVNKQEQIERLKSIVY